MPTDDLNLDLTASFRRFREQVLDAPSAIWAGNYSSVLFSAFTLGSFRSIIIIQSYEQYLLACGCFSSW